ncbi:MAG TPA: PIG-L family deacetylase [Tepidisphaeraceae bacterium]|nr:PIG-L family deacetylase [Tepidisphaeraceae bacterium]
MEQLRIMVIGAHPDDGEFRCGGAAALWAARGHRVCFLSVTNGQSGHHELGAAELVQRRMAEAQASAAVLGIESRVLPIADGYLEPTLENRMMLIRAIREFGADLVITNRPNDYHPDHRYTSQLVQDSAFMLTVPQVAPEVVAMRKNPVILYFWDGFRKPMPFEADVVIDIDNVFEKKIAALDRHVSQVYEWLPWLDGRLDEVPQEAKARFAWLREWYLTHAQPGLADRYRGQLVARYGATRGAQVREVEAFEVCEYGSPLDERQAERLFGGM